MKKQHVIVSHGHCPDGAAAVVVAKRLERHCEYVCGLHGKVDDQILDVARRMGKGGVLWIVDICCGPETLAMIFDILKVKNCRIGIYEHHISRDYLAEVVIPEGIDAEIVFDNHRCGARIFYEAMKAHHPTRLDGLDEFITLTNDRDLWLNADIRSAEMSSLHSILGEERYIQRFCKNPKVTFDETERVLLDYEKEQMMRRMHKMLDSIKISTDANGYRYGVMVGEGKASEICNAAIHKFNLEYVCLFDYNGGRASIRSHKEFDCAEFSVQRGGGGHQRAAGFALTTPSYDLYPKT
jgi:oligoribonuclease NrnB/cAMP/cGMP phosphodiesterase (DHH superfamily)